MAYEFMMLDGAQHDYEGIIEYLTTVANNPEPARAFADEFDRQIALVCENPNLYDLSRMPYLAALGYHAVFVGSYVVLCFFRQNTVFAAHVFHQRQDYARLAIRPKGM